MNMRDVLPILATLAFLTMMGGATYEHIAVVPAWSEAPPASLHMFQGDYALRAGNFWMAIHPVTLLLMIGALVANWNTARRKNLLLVSGGYILILAVSFLYFVPTLLGFMSSPYSETVDQDLLGRTSMWETLSLIRLAFIAIMAYLLVHTLIKSGQQETATTPATVPLSYRNDALGG